jgi:hypothetical protein
MLENLDIDFLRKRYEQIVNEIEILTNDVVPKLEKFDTLKKELEEIELEITKRYNSEPGQSK